jgi:phosphohistidine phosphatase
VLLETVGADEPPPRAGRAAERSGAAAALLRHAESDWSRGQDDHGASLARRGRREADRQELARRLVAPGAIFARRPGARERSSWALTCTERCPRRISASTSRAETLLARSRTYGSTLLVVGHNPGLEELAGQLAGGGDEEALARLARKFPTGALADLRFAAKRWRDLAPGSGRLAAFVWPRELDG